MTRLALALGLFLVVTIGSDGRSALAEAGPVSQAPVSAVESTEGGPTTPNPDDQFPWKDDGETEAVEAKPWWRTLASFIMRFLFVLGLVAATLYGLKRFLALRAPLGDGRVMVLEQTRLVGTQSLCLVQAGTRIMLLGTNGAGLLVKLGEWPADQAPPSVAEAMFRQQLQRVSPPGEPPRGA
ncbi:MAG: flagellar biosynthetic protein FliO [Candidatus Sericytochromatia bacterium]|nr:flagellar biosynthetic protein FliO [Candidatus Sericytochromatia bacterium]